MEYVNDGEEGIDDESLAEEALDAVKNIAETWQEFKDDFIAISLGRRRQEREREAAREPEKLGDQ